MMAKLKPKLRQSIRLSEAIRASIGRPSTATVRRSPTLSPSAVAACGNAGASGEIGPTSRMTRLATPRAGRPVITLVMTVESSCAWASATRAGAITLDSGQQNFALYLFDNQSMESYNPSDHWVDTVTAEVPLENTVTFAKPQGPSTLVLTTGTGRAITALPISG